MDTWALAQGLFQRASASLSKLILSIVSLAVPSQLLIPQAHQGVCAQGLGTFAPATHFSLSFVCLAPAPSIHSQPDSDDPCIFPSVLHGFMLLIPFVSSISGINWFLF